MTAETETSLGHRHRWIALFLVVAVLVATGCDRSKKRKASHGPAARLAPAQRDQSVRFLESIAATLNDLASEIDVDLQPPQVILDAMHSTDKKEVLAVCSANPQVPDGPFNYLSVPAGNANFRRLRVRPGDIVRYYIHYDQDSLEHGYKQRTFLQLTVRRLDDRNPDNALIIEGGLTGPVPQPERLEIWRYSDKRMNEIRNRLRVYMELRKPAVAWEPSPEEAALLHLVERTNQWLRGRRSKETVALIAWQADPLVAKLPEQLRTAKPLAASLRAESLRDDLFPASDGRLLQQAIWLRDISGWARGSALTDVEVATALFDWTVRNVQLDAPGGATIVFHPWQVLMYGHGTAEQRAWVFAELCRQQQLDVVMLATTTGNGAASNAGDDDAGDNDAGDNSATPGTTTMRWWLPALWSDGQLYLFDTRLGLPVPGAEDESVATLAEVVGNPRRLRQLDIGDASDPTAMRYPIDAESLARIEVQLIATPLQLSRRAVQLEQVLEGDKSVLLTAETRRLAEELGRHEHVADVRLWDAPFRAIVAEQQIKPRARQQAALRFVVFAQRPKLWKARVLHFQGLKPVPPELRDDPLAEPRRGHREALRLYQDRRVRPSEDRLREMPPDKQAIYRIAKGDASYWLGLLCYDMGKLPSATHWLEQRTLGASPNGPWTAGARYNLARTLEAQGKLERAVESLEADQSPSRHGNLLRARRLRQRLDEAKKKKTP